jgi:hypothetical protein
VLLALLLQQVGGQHLRVPQSIAQLACAANTAQLKSSSWRHPKAIRRYQEAQQHAWVLGVGALPGKRRQHAGHAGLMLRALLLPVLLAQGVHGILPRGDLQTSWISVCTT